MTATPFDQMSDFLAIPRLGALALSPDGERLVVTVAELNEDGNRHVEALWALDTGATEPARRLTWSEAGESGPVFEPDGGLLFRSSRGKDEGDPPALYRLPGDGGEAHQVLDCAGGVSAVAVARVAGDIVASTPRLLGAGDDDADRARRDARRDAKTTAILHERSPIRHWDHDLGPAELHLLAVSRDGGEPTDLTPEPGRALDEQSFTLSPDGSTVVATWAMEDEPGYPTPRLVAIDRRSGQRRVLVEDRAVFYSDPDVSPDGRTVVCWAQQDASYDDPPFTSLVLVDLASGDKRDLVSGADLTTGPPQFSADGSAVFFTANDSGHAPVFRADVASGEVTRLTSSGHFTNVCVHPDGQTLFAMRDHVDSPPAPVRLDATAADGDVTVIPSPGQQEVPGRLEDISTVAEDGTTIRSFLALPDDASAERPAPLVLWIHGGPLSSWNSWTWRWSPWLMVAKGYAVLLPDPALSTGYGEKMVRRGWGQWGGTPYTDLMAATDAVVERADIDETRTAAMGGSYGGYMANWVAGHTDRFRCIVTHASLWALDQFQGTTDFPAFWAREFGPSDERPERYENWSPHKSLDNITTPMLVIHGDKDYRVPIGEGLRLWWDLQRKGVESKYLYFSDEGHWILKPGNAIVWYETVWAWLATYLRDEPWQRPELL